MHACDVVIVGGGYTGLSAALQFIVFGAAIIVGMLVSGDRVASLLGRLLRRIEASAATHPEATENTS